eukprot:3902788-Prymnesium_polylepis.1
MSLLTPAAISEHLRFHQKCTWPTLVNASVTMPHASERSLSACRKHARVPQWPLWRLSELSERPPHSALCDSIAPAGVRAGRPATLLLCRASYSSCGGALALSRSHSSAGGAFGRTVHRPQLGSALHAAQQRAPFSRSDGDRLPKSLVRWAESPTRPGHCTSTPWLALQPSTPKLNAPRRLSARLACSTRLVAGASIAA